MDQIYPENPEKIVCRYYLKASCHAGKDCPVSHVRSPDCIPDDLCRFYLKGRCFIGEKCIFRHAKLPQYFNVLRQKQKQTLQLSPTRDLCDENLVQSEVPRENVMIKSKTLNWVNAPEFFPEMEKTYPENLEGEKHDEKLKSKSMCYFPIEYCPYDDKCPYVHGDLCEICESVYLHPYDEDQRKAHKEMCIKELEEDMNYSFAIQRSLDKTCGICMDVILDKDFSSDRRFGILENCNHVFCLSCIRKWRSVKRYENRRHSSILDPFVTRACPECRRPSDFVTPSPVWFENEEDKHRMIADYKRNLGRRHCKYFKRGDGTCNFGSTCFYLHAKPDGTVVKLPAPTRKKRQNQRMRSEYLGNNSRWDFEITREEIMSMNLNLEDNSSWDFETTIEEIRSMNLDIDDFMYNLSFSGDNFLSDTYVAMSSGTGM